MTTTPIADVGLFFRVAGVPRAQPRGRHVGGRVVSTTGPARVWRQQVKAAALAAMEAVIADGRRFPLTGPVEFRLAVSFPTKDESRWGEWRTAHEDRDFDNVEKLPADCLKECGVYRDDGQIARAVYEAVWCRPEAAGVAVAVIPLRARQRALESVAAPGWLG